MRSPYGELPESLLFATVVSVEIGQAAIRRGHEIQIAIPIDISIGGPATDYGPRGRLRPPSRLPSEGKNLFAVGIARMESRTPTLGDRADQETENLE